MRFVILSALVCAAPVCAQTAAGPGNAAPQPVIIRDLRSAGILPQSPLAASEAVADEVDEGILRRTLYGAVSAQDLTEQQADDMVAAARRILERKTASLERVKTLVAEGVAPRLSLEPAMDDAARAQQTLDLAMNRAKLFRELAEMARAERDALTRTDAHAGPEPVYERYDGAGIFHSGDLKKILLAFESRFDKPLPISANGETALHRSLGFDHRGRVDVAVDPDQEEGRWLRELLETLKIPYYAFRASVRGKSTGPHIHIGPPSERLSLGG